MSSLAIHYPLSGLGYISIVYTGCLSRSVSWHNGLPVRWEDRRCWASEQWSRLAVAGKRTWQRGSFFVRIVRDAMYKRWQHRRNVDRLKARDTKPVGRRCCSSNAIRYLARTYHYVHASHAQTNIITAFLSVILRIPKW